MTIAELREYANQVDAFRAENRALEARVAELEAELAVTRKANMHVDGRVAAVKIAKAEARVADLEAALVDLRGVAETLYIRCRSAETDPDMVRAFAVIATANKVIGRSEFADSVGAVDCSDCGKAALGAVYCGSCYAANVQAERSAAIEECAKVCDKVESTHRRAANRQLARHNTVPNEQANGALHCAAQIRKLATRTGNTER
ncbi:MAG: hypothetical protein KF850_33105 [Labilithrix sp.]|nr:hypothetical protein [Labilithrix sp.]MBX3216918.1 hypothetical protein [Labilithrix sp.]